MGAALVIPYQLGAPATGRLVRSLALRQVSTINVSVNELEQALAGKDWVVIQQQAVRAVKAAERLGNTQLVATSLAGRQQTPAIEHLRGQLASVNESLLQVQQASREKDYGRLKAALQGFRVHFSAVNAAAEGAEK
jgi:hypothetical protein